MKPIRLFSGEINNDQGTTGTSSIERDCVLCYEGIFESLDGEVQVTRQNLERIAQNYNAKIAKSASSNNGEPLDRHCAPVQLDHSTSSSVTVGRVKSYLNVKPYRTLDGKEVMGLFGKVTVKGKDNVERVVDGRWTNVSIGADFEQNIMSELTITPFPAAAEASILSKRLSNDFYTYKLSQGVSMSKKKMENKDDKEKLEGNKPDDKKELSESDIEKIAIRAAEHLKKMSQSDENTESNDKKKELSNAEDLPESKLSNGDKEDEKKLSNAEDLPESKLTDGDKEEEKKLSNAEDLPEAKKMQSGEGIHIDIDSHKNDKEKEEMKKKLSEEKDGDKKELSDGDKKDVDDDKEEKEMTKLQKKYMKMLIDKEEMEEDKAKMKCLKMNDDEIEDAIKKHEDTYHRTQEKVDENDDPKKKLSAKKRLSKMILDLKSSTNVAKLSLVKAKISNRLSSLKANAKITPAELKSIDLNELAEMDETSREKMFKLMEKREPVIHTGIYGTHKGINLYKLAQNVKELEAREMEEDIIDDMPTIKKARLAKGNTKENPIHAASLNPDTIDHYNKNIAKMADEGNIKEVKRLMSDHFEDIKRLAIGEKQDHVSSSERIEELEKTIINMEKQFNNIAKTIEELVK